MYCWMDHIKHVMGYDQYVTPHHEHSHENYVMGYDQSVTPHHEHSHENYEMNINGHRRGRLHV